MLTIDANRMSFEDSCIQLIFLHLLPVLLLQWNHYGGKYLLFVSSRSVKMGGFSFLSLYKSVFILQSLNVKMYNYGKQNIIVNFIIKKLKKTQFSQKV